MNLEIKVSDIGFLSTTTADKSGFVDVQFFLQSESDDEVMAVADVRVFFKDDSQSLAQIKQEAKTRAIQVISQIHQLLDDSSAEDLSDNWL